MLVKCVICDKECKVKPFRIKRLKGGKFCCSRECSAQLRKIAMLGSNNHQYGLIGDKNSSFVGEITVSNLGYKLKYCPGHPRPHDKATKGVRVKEHRLIIEQNYKIFPSNFFEKINGWIVLKQQYDVHHIDENRLNNDISNLMVLLRSEHTILHNKDKIIQRCSKGKIIGVIKSDKLLENPEEDNQQPI